jgi:excinuclease ABC subunit C
MRRSRLDDIPGLGYQRQKQLLATFRSIDYLRQATPQQIATVPGIGPRLAQQIYEYFHPPAEEFSFEVTNPSRKSLPEC